MICPKIFLITTNLALFILLAAIIPGFGAEECNDCISFGGGTQIVSVHQEIGSNAIDSNNATGNSAALKQHSSIMEMLAPISGISSSDIILDVSPDTKEYIEGAISIPYTRFYTEGGDLRPVTEISKILGDAGITHESSVVVYGECLPCGGGPSTATYVYWVLKYLGHDSVKILDGGIKDWKAAGLPTEAKPKILAKANFIPSIKPNLLATYDYVNNGYAQIIDARTPEEYNISSIPGSINLPSDKVMNGSKIKDEVALRNQFRGLNKDSPVVVYTNTGVKASLLWFALELMGYDARLYSWADWLANQPKIDISLDDASAAPNPSNSGNTIIITAVFGEGNRTSSGSNASDNGAVPSNEVKLTTKGCSDCGFGGFPKPDTSGGIAKIGDVYRKAPDNALNCTAIIINSAGKEVSEIKMRQVSGAKYAGIWTASVPKGVYNVTFTVSTSGISKSFKDALEIQITD